MRNYFFHRERAITKVDINNDPTLNEDTYWQKLLKYIPTESVGAYTVLSGLAKTEAYHIQWKVFLFVLILTPIYAYFSTIDANKSKPYYHTIVAFISFPVWAYALGGIFQTDTVGYRSAIASIILICTTLVIPIIERFVIKPIKP